MTITTAQLLGVGINLSDAGETIYAYQGLVDAPTRFLYAADIADGNTTFNGNLTNTGLVIGTTAVAIAGDAGVFGDRGHNLQSADLLASIGNAVNWTSNDDSPQPALTGNLLSAPDQQVFVAIAGDAGLTRLARDGSDIATQQVNLFQTNSDPATQFNHPNDLVFDTVHGLFFVADSDSGNRRILQGNIADLGNPGVAPTLKVLYSDQSPGTDNGQILGLAIDVDAATGRGDLYFVNQNNFEKISYAHNGISALAQTATVLAQLPDGNFANEIALDIANHRAFVLSTASDTQPVEVASTYPGAMYDADSGTYYIVSTLPANNEIWQVSGLDRTDTTTADTTMPGSISTLSRPTPGEAQVRRTAMAMTCPMPRGCWRGSTSIRRRTCFISPRSNMAAARRGRGRLHLQPGDRRDHQPVRGDRHDRSLARTDRRRSGVGALLRHQHRVSGCG